MESSVLDGIENAIEETKDVMRKRQSLVTYLCWALLVGSAIFSALTQNWSTVFLSAVVFILTLVPFVFQSLSQITLPRGFVGAIVFFMVATIFLGEAGNFYERFWWWDAALHTFSAIGFSIMGMLIVLFLVKDDRIRSTPPSMLVLMAFSFAVSIGAVWEVFEFGMDQLVGTNMQKSGLIDTMFDLIVDVGGAAIGASAGYVYLKSRRKGKGVLSQTIEKVVDDNPEIFESTQ
ncbi:MAG: hypothetical protein HKN36_00600 [Hellea sp.]|nr:hypothetical protein [Hellea sp.]